MIVLASIRWESKFDFSFDSTLPTPGSAVQCAFSALCRGRAADRPLALVRPGEIAAAFSRFSVFAAVRIGTPCSAQTGSRRAGIGERSPTIWKNHQRVLVDTTL
jgi:hypothetical protein